MMRNGPSCNYFFKANLFFFFKPLHRPTTADSAVSLIYLILSHSEKSIFKS